MGGRWFVSPVVYIYIYYNDMWYIKTEYGMVCRMHAHLPITASKSDIGYCNGFPSLRTSWLEIVRPSFTVRVSLWCMEMPVVHICNQNPQGHLGRVQSSHGGAGVVTWNDLPTFPGVRSSEVVLGMERYSVNDTLILDLIIRLSSIWMNSGRYFCHIVSWPGQL